MTRIVGSRSRRLRCPRSWASSSAISATPGGRCTSTAGRRSEPEGCIDAQREIAGATGRIPTIDELAQYLELSTEEVLDGLQTAEAYGTVSLDAPVGSDEDGTPSRLDAIGDEDERFALIDDRATIFAAAMCLPERERRILFLRFGEDLTQSEIADRVGVSQMQVSRLLRRSLQRLRDLTDDRQPKLKR